MFTRKLQLPQQGMPTAEEFALWGARELSFEELLEVNGGKREKKKNRAAGVHPPVRLHLMKKRVSRLCKAVHRL